jgi:hypothetical protein
MKMLLSIVVLVVVSLTSAEELSLSLSYPDSSNPSIIRFTCKNGEDRAMTATFQKNGEEITDQVSVIINSADILEFAQTSSNGLGGTFTCTDNGATSNAVTLPGTILTVGLSDETVEGGSTVEFMCVAVASDYQPEIVWMFGSEVYTGCMERSRYCIENEEFEVAKLTLSTFTIETEDKSSVHLITCYVQQEQAVRDIAMLTVEKGKSASKEAGIIGGTSVSALVVLITTTVVAALAYWLKQHMNKKKNAIPLVVPADGALAIHIPPDGNPSDGNPFDGNPAGVNPSDGNPTGVNPSDGNPAGGNPSDGNPRDSDIIPLLSVDPSC